MKKNLLKDILVFVVITVAASLSLAMVNSITKDPIARQNEKIIQDSKIIRYSFYELRVKENLNEEEVNRFLELIKNKLEKMNYRVFFTGAKFEYEEANRTVQENELMIAINYNFIS